MNNYYEIILITENGETFAINNDCIVYDHYITISDECVYFNIIIDIDHLEHTYKNLPLRLKDYPDIVLIERHYNQSYEYDSYNISWDSLPKMSFVHPEQIVHFINQKHLMVTYTKKEM